MSWFKKKGESSEDEQEGQSAQPPPVSGQQKIRVLAVDDEVFFTNGLKLNLEGKGGYVVETVNDPRKALMVARQFGPDVILLDVVMPEMDGGDVKAKFAMDPELNGVPIIMVTALVSEDEHDPDSVVESGHNVMLGKPLKMAKLVACIEQILAGQI